MECMRAMSSVCSGRPSLAIGRSSGVSTRGGETARCHGRVAGRVASLRLQSAPNSRGALRGGGSRGLGKWPTRASSSAGDEIDEATSGAGREFEDTKQRAGSEFEDTKQRVGSSVEDLKGEASGGVSESKQSFSNTVEDFKSVVGKAQSQAEETANKELEKLKDITNQLLEQAELARQKLTATAQETAHKQKDNLAFVVENGPKPVKEVAETALNAHYSESGKTGSKIHDFCLGIPFGAFLCIGGLLWFIIYGSTSAIRFGVLLGSAILFLSTTSLKKWKQGKSSIAYIQAQAAITAFIFLRYYRRYSVTKAFFPTAVTGLISGAMLGFYIYVLMSGGNPPKKPKTESI